MFRCSTVGSNMSIDVRDFGSHRFKLYQYLTGFPQNTNAFLAAMIKESLDQYFAIAA